MRPLVLLLPVLASGCLVFVGWSEPRAWVEGERAFEVDPVGLAQVSCTTHNGDVSISGVDGADRIRVRVRTRAGGEDEADAAAAHEAIEILHKRVDGGLWLGWQWREPRRGTWQASVAFDVTQPRSMPSKVETHNGDVRVRDLGAPVVATSHNGDIALLGCAGEVSGTSHNGHIAAETSGASLNLTSHNGSLQVRVGGEGPLQGELRSHNGGITLAVDGERSVRLVCNTHNGRVTCDRNLTRLEQGRTFLVGEMGSAEGRLAVETYNGRIRVE